MGMACNLSVITPVSRPDLLPRVAQSVPEGAEWILVTDGPLKIPDGLTAHTLVEGPKTGRWGDVQRQIGLGEATRPYVYFLDDDNLMLPTLAELVIPYLCEGSISGVLFGLLVQTRSGLRIWIPPRRVEAGRVDTAMFLGARDAVLGLHFEGTAPGRGWPDLQGQRWADFVFLRAFEARYGLPVLPAVYGFHNGLDLLGSAEVAGLIRPVQDLCTAVDSISVIHECLLRQVQAPSW
jgi:hypothetical protein